MSGPQHVPVAYHCALAASAHSRTTGCRSDIQGKNLIQEVEQLKDFTAVLTSSEVICDVRDRLGCLGVLFTTGKPAHYDIYIGTISASIEVKIKTSKRANFYRAGSFMQWNLLLVGFFTHSNELVARYTEK